MHAYTCPKCDELFRVVYLSGSFPGGKEREDVNCPTCHHTIGSEVTSAVLSTKVLTAEEKSVYLSQKLY